MASQRLRVRLDFSRALRALQHLSLQWIILLLLVLNFCLQNWYLQYFTMTGPCRLARCQLRDQKRLQQSQQQKRCWRFLLASKNGLLHLGSSHIFVREAYGT